MKLFIQDMISSFTICEHVCSLLKTRTRLPQNVRARPHVTQARQSPRQRPRPHNNPKSLEATRPALHMQVDIPESLGVLHTLHIFDSSAAATCYNMGHKGHGIQLL